MRHGIEAPAHEAIDAAVLGKALQVMREGTRREVSDAVQPFVTISREYGCQGTELAVELARILNGDPSSADPERPWMYYDKNLLDRVAEDHNLKKEVIEAAERQSRGVIEQYVSKALVDKPDDYDVFQYVLSAMTTLALRGRVILVGRGAAIATQGLPGGVHVRIYSGEAFKIHRMKQRMPELADRPDDLRAAIEKEGRRRESFVERHMAASPRDPKFYHLMINNDRFSLGEMAEMVRCLVRSVGKEG